MAGIAIISRKAPLIVALACFFAGWGSARDGLMEGLDLAPGGSLLFDAAYRNLWWGLSAISLAWAIWAVTTVNRGHR